MNPTKGGRVILQGFVGYVQIQKQKWMLVYTIDDDHEEGGEEERGDYG